MTETDGHCCTADGRHFVFTHQGQHMATILQVWCQIKNPDFVIWCIFTWRRLLPNFIPIDLKQRSLRLFLKRSVAQQEDDTRSVLDYKLLISTTNNTTISNNNEHTYKTRQTQVNNLPVLTTNLCSFQLVLQGPTTFHHSSSASQIFSIQQST